MTIKIIGWSDEQLNLCGLQKGSLSEKDMEILVEYAVLAGISCNVFYLGNTFEAVRSMLHYNNYHTYWIDADFLEEVLITGILDNNNDNKSDLQIHSTK